MKIAILGATGHLAKCAFWVFSQDIENDIFLFSRSSQRAEEIRRHFSFPNTHVITDYNQFPNYAYDVIFNGIGAWDLPGAPVERIFSVTEFYDNLVIHYQEDHPHSKSIHISSGAVYAGDYTQAVGEGTKTVLDMNSVSVGDYYSIAKINSEAKHRAYRDLNIVDLRLFGFFSRYMNLDYPYFLSAMIKAAKNKSVFYAVNENFWRDYIHLADFAKLLNSIAKSEHINTAIDVRSKAPVSIEEVICFFSEKYGLVVNPMKKGKDIKISKTGIKPFYFSRRGTDLYNPSYTSMDTIASEVKFFLGDGYQ